jgi:hypothetical protein
MAEHLNARAYELLWSPYDQIWHVVLDDQSVRPMRLFVVALCTHSVLTAFARRTPPDSLCLPCAHELTLLLNESLSLRMAG